MKHLLCLILCICLISITSGKDFTLLSPDKNIEAVITLDSKIDIIAHYQSRVLFKLEDISLEIEGEDFTSGINKIKKTETNSISRQLHPPIKEKYREINEEFNELINILSKGRAR